VRYEIDMAVSLYRDACRRGDVLGRLFYTRAVRRMVRVAMHGGCREKWLVKAERSVG
jgi:hypothetical protein